MLALATPTHVAALAAIHAAAFPPGETWDTAAFAAQLALPGVFGFIGTPGGLVLGRVAADEAEILTLGVAPPARRGGMARALLAAAEAHAARLGAASMFLEVAEANLAARGLYGAAGYAPVGRRRRYYPDGGDALVLRRALAPATSPAVAQAASDPAA